MPEISSSSRSRRGSHFSAFSSFTTKTSKSTSTNPLKNIVSRSSPPVESKYSSVSTPINNPGRETNKQKEGEKYSIILMIEAAYAMHPLNQKNYDISPSSTLRQPTLPAGLKNEINHFAIDGYAKKYFSTHKKGLFRRRVPINKMLKWSKVRH